MKYPSKVIPLHYTSTNCKNLSQGESKLIFCLVDISFLLVDLQSRMLKIPKYKSRNSFQAHSYTKFIHKAKCYVRNGLLP